MRFAILKVFGRVIFFCEERKDFEKKKDERRKTDDDAMHIIKKWIKMEEEESFLTL